MASSDVLGRLPGLREANGTSLHALSDQFDRTSYRDGELICDEGSPAETLYVLASGTVEVRKRSISGREHKVAVLNAPCMFGHVGVLALTERTASIRATGEVEVLHMSARRARVIMRTGDFEVASPFRRALIVAMCQQLASATAAVANLAVDAGVAEPRNAEDTFNGEELVTMDPEGRTEAESSVLPEDAEERLLKGLSQI